MARPARQIDATNAGLRALELQGGPLPEPQPRRAPAPGSAASSDNEGETSPHGSVDVGAAELSPRSHDALLERVAGLEAQLAEAHRRADRNRVGPRARAYHARGFLRSAREVLIFYDWKRLLSNLFHY
jgi:hypothetical protein